MSTHFTDQREYRIRCEQGERGLLAIADGVRHFVIIDVLSFTTCVDVGVSRGAEIIPYRWRDEGAQVFAGARGALLAGRPGSPYSLVVESIATLAAGTRLVLPSPNGSTLAQLAAERATVVAACLRNASAVSAYLNEQDGAFAIIAAGERWADGSLRPCFEDVVGAGAIISGLRGARSPEAESAAAVYTAVRDRLSDVLFQCSSGRELVERGHPRNVELAAQLDVSSCVPILREGSFTRA
jgi:2-phosphosulfolactate phosphatase